MAPWLRGVGDGEHSANSAIYDVSHVPFQAPTVLYLSSSSNYKQKSLYGFRISTLLGWVGGDSFKYSHFSIHARLQVAKFMIFAQDGLLFRTRESIPVQDLCNFPTVSGHW